MRKKLHDPKDGQMIVVGLMSGSGSNIRKILDYELQLKIEKGESPYHMAAIFSDSKDSKAEEIGEYYGLPVIIRDIEDFYAKRGRNRSELVANFSDDAVKLREEFDTGVVRALAQFNAKVAAYGGYMSIASDPLIKAFLGVNVHPADLSITKDGRPKYTGRHAVRDAILAREEYIFSTTHLVENAIDDGKVTVDTGRILMVSKPLEVILVDFNPLDPERVKNAEDFNQDRLKEAGDWEIFPKTLQHIAEGRYEQDDQGNLYFDGKRIPIGVRL